MYPSFNLERLNRQKEELEKLINDYKQVQPINNFISTNQATPKDLIEWRILNENEEVDNLYVANKTLFINDNLMVLKGVDGSLEKWEVKKIYPIDKKDEKINQLEEEIKKLKEMIGNEHTKSNEPVRNGIKSNANDDELIDSKSKTNIKSIQK